MSGDTSGNSNKLSNSSDKDEIKFVRWIDAVSKITGIGSPGSPQEQKKQSKDKRDVETLVAKLKKCSEWKESHLKYSPGVTFMLKNLEKVGCKVEPYHIRCIDCSEATRCGGFLPLQGIITLCANRLGDKSHQEATLIHEMVHMFDHCRFKVNWKDCRHHACSEVRAATLSGDCRWSKEFKRGFFTFTKQHQACAKRRAILSVGENAYCNGKGEAENAVNQVFDSCFNDTRPFEEIY